MSLAEYRKKRDFTKTREPKPKLGRKTGRSFVVQEHHASHLHWDFRLELDGVLKSWAVPKGPSMKPKEKRLAVQVEDHPLSYGKFEGTIPKGEYGAGTVKIWDHGEWIPTASPQQQLKKGHLEFELKGERLSGDFMLVRTGMYGGGKRTNWLLIKRTDEHKPAALPDFIPPQLASLVSAPPAGAEWIHEIKFDGYRTACRIDGNNVRMLTRSGLDWSDKYKSLVTAASELKAKSAYLDGEVVWADENGKTQFQGLQNVLKNRKDDRLLYYVFDILHLDGKDLRPLPLLQRKVLLQKVLKRSKGERIIFSDHWNQKGSEVFRASCGLELEGIISKDGSQGYSSGRSDEWVKSKCKHIQEFVIGGYTMQKDNPALGSLLVGAYDESKKFRYLGRVGTGYGQSAGLRLIRSLTKYKVAKSPFQVSSPPKRGRTEQLQFVKPMMVANIEFGAWTEDKILRHAAFKGLREDKEANEVMVDEVQADSLVTITHPNKVIFPKTKNTKQNLADFYTEIQDWILPHIARRPLSLLRCPNGAGKACFFQKHVDRELLGISTISAESSLKGKAEDIMYVESLKGIMGLVQMGALELHTWGCHIDNIDAPDQIVFDFDPEESVTWTNVKKTAFVMKEILQKIGLQSFVKVTGGKGLHVHVPIEPVYDWDQVKVFSKTICERLEIDRPQLYTTSNRKADRGGKIFLDYLRNGYGATAITPYSLRAKVDATVALPISWEELKTLKGPNLFNLEKTLKILKKRSAEGKDPWADYFFTKQRVQLLDNL